MTNVILELPVDLKERRKVLEKELSKVVVELSFTGLRKDLNKLFEEFKVEPNPTNVTWEFYGEYDDEGGTTYYPRGVTVYAGEVEIECDEYVINKKSSWSDSYYDYELEEEIREILCGYRHDLYEHDIEEIEL